MDYLINIKLSNFMEDSVRKYYNLKHIIFLYIDIQQNNIK